MTSLQQFVVKEGVDDRLIGLPLHHAPSPSNLLFVLSFPSQLCMTSLQQFVVKERVGDLLIGLPLLHPPSSFLVLLPLPHPPSPHNLLLVFSFPSQLCMTSLQQFVVKEGVDDRLAETRVWDVLLDLLRAVKHLHDSDLIHFDIKLVSPTKWP